MDPRPLRNVWSHRTPKRMWSDTRVEGRHWLYVLVVLTRHEFRSRYRAQALGMVWSLLNPVVMMAILSIVFTTVFRSATPHFPVFLLIGLILWNFISASCISATHTFVSYGELVKRTAFPRPLLPIAVMMSHLLHLFIECLVLLAFIPIFPNAFKLTPALLIVPLVLFFVVVLVAGAALAFSVLNVIYRDVAYLVTTAMSILYWVTPNIYPVEIIAEPYQTALKVNPLTGILRALRGAVMNGEVPTLLGWASIAAPALAIFGLGWLVFRHYERWVLDHV